MGSSPIATHPNTLTSSNVLQTPPQQAARLWTASFAFTCAATLMLFVSYHVLTPILPGFFGQRFADGMAVGTLIAAFLAASLATRPFAGVLADSTSPHRLMAWGLGGFSLAALAYPAMGSFEGLLLVRLAQGICYALFYTGAAAAIARQAPASRKGEGLAWFSNAIKIAMAIAPVLGLWAAEQWHALAPFALSALAALGALALALRTPRAGAMGAVGEHPANAALNWARFHPRRMIDAGAVFPGLLMTSNTLLFGAMMAYAPLLVSEKGMASQGWFYTVFATALIASRSFTGVLSDRFGRAAVALPGVTLTILAVALLAMASHPGVFLAATALYGFAAGTVQPSLMAMAADRATPQRQGAAMATFTLFNDLGLVIGSFLMPYWGALLGYGHALLLLCGFTTLGWAVLVAHLANVLRPARVKPWVSSS